MGEMTARAWAEAIDAIAALADSEIDAMKLLLLEAARIHSWDLPFRIHR